MQTQLPLISVITVVRNANGTIAEAVESALVQDYPNLEFVVIDGASTDGTLEIIQRYGERIAALVSEPDNGIYHAMNKGIARSTGEMLIFLNADDTFTDPHAVGLLAETRAAQPKVPTICYSDYFKYYPSLGRSLGLPTSEAFARGMTMCQQAMLVDRAAFDLAGGFDASYRLAADLDWVIRAKEAGVRFKKASVPPVATLRGGGLSDRQHARSRAEIREIVRKHYGLWPYLILFVLHRWTAFLRSMARGAERLIGRSCSAGIQTVYMRVVRRQWPAATDI